MSKVKIIDKKSEKSILGERDLLSKLKHPFIVNMLCAFQDYENLYLLMDLLTGGDLRYHFNSKHIFSEKEIKFFISCIILSLEYIHENNIIHRDIKPENLVSDDKGYIRLTDFGIAKVKKEENSSETSGTPGYMAPEVLLSQNHSFTVDFYAIGIVGYEFLVGKRPYIGKNRKEIKELVLSKEVCLENSKDNSWSNECLDFINKCLKRKPTNRLGYHFGVKELKTHPWFEKYDWQKLYYKTLDAPFVPKKENNFDKEYCQSIDKISNSTFERYKGYMRKNDYIKIFEGYTYFNNELTSNTGENETVTRVSTSTKGNKQEIIENQSHLNIFSNPSTNNKVYNIAPLRNIFESSLSKNKGHSVDHRIIFDKKIEKKSNLENYQYHEENNNFNSRSIPKLGENKNYTSKKQITVDILNINKKLKDELNSKLSENNTNYKEMISEKQNSFELKESKSNKNMNNIHLINKINLNDNSINNNININSINNSMNDNINDLNNLNKLKKRNIFSSNSLGEKPFQGNNDKNEKNINISIFNFKKFKKKKLNIHSLSNGIQTKDFNLEDKKIDNKIMPVLLPPLIKRKNSILNPLFFSNIKQFKFKITKKRKIKYVNFNQNKIIENHNNNLNQNGQKLFTQFLYKCAESSNNDRNVDSSDNNNTKDYIGKKDLFRRKVNDEKVKNLRLQLGKSQSSGLFPKIKIS